MLITNIYNIDPSNDVKAGGGNQDIIFFHLGTSTYLSLSTYRLSSVPFVVRLRNIRRVSFVEI